jgi:hypothetical protein
VGTATSTTNQPSPTPLIPLPPPDPDASTGTTLSTGGIVLIVLAVILLIIGIFLGTCYYRNHKQHQQHEIPFGADRAGGAPAVHVNPAFVPLPIENGRARDDNLVIIDNRQRQFLVPMEGGAAAPVIVNPADNAADYMVPVALNPLYHYAPPMAPPGNGARAGAAPQELAYAEIDETDGNTIRPPQDVDGYVVDGYDTDRRDGAGRGGRGGGGRGRGRAGGGRTVPLARDANGYVVDDSTAPKTKPVDYATYISSTPADAGTYAAVGNDAVYGDDLPYGAAGTAVTGEDGYQVFENGGGPGAGGVLGGGDGAGGVRRTGRQQSTYDGSGETDARDGSDV